jgi:coproporphyrinogen III oxidase
MQGNQTQQVRTYLVGLQSRIVEGLQGVDGKPFGTDSWDRPEGGGGTTRIRICAPT